MVCAVVLASCSKKDSNDEPGYQLVGSWMLSNTKANVGGLFDMPLSLSQITLNADKTGSIAYTNLAGTAETAHFAWELNGDKVVLNDPKGELSGLFTDATIPTPVVFEIKNYTDRGFDISSTINAKFNGNDVVIVITGRCDKSAEE